MSTQKLKNIIKWLIIVAILIALAIIVRSVIIKINYPEKYEEYIEKYSKEYGVESELIFAIIKAESNFKQNAISNKEAIGLMQLLESTALEVAENINKEITKEDILNPEVNIELGTKYISTLINKYENIELALAAYNAGIGNVDRWIEEGTIKADGTDIENVPYKETNNYIRKVIRNYNIYSKIRN